MLSKLLYSTSADALSVVLAAVAAGFVWENCSKNEKSSQLVKMAGERREPHWRMAWYFCVGRGGIIGGAREPAMVTDVSGIKTPQTCLWKGGL
mmetsp:Transcript_10258/g.20629  ORF Transcript_10258/g.20629 Transcript_10258/m.20629 type:complete len:93 (+) Transcript_10258:1926-2204(+)